MKIIKYPLPFIMVLLAFIVFSVSGQAVIKTDIELVSRAADGTPGNETSYRGSISNDGRYVTFYSFATDLVTTAGASNTILDVFVLDRQASTNAIKQISLTPGKLEPDQSSFDPIISGDGTIVIFVSNASNLDTFEASTENDGDIFIYNVNDEIVRRITLDINGQETDGDSRSPALSRNGRFIVFRSSATDLVANDTNGVDDVFLYDRNTETFEIVGIPPVGITWGGEGGAGTDTSGWLSVSDAGDVLFRAGSTDDPTRNHLYLRKRNEGTTIRIDKTPIGGYPNGSVSSASISADGAWVAYESQATNILDVTDLNGNADIFLYEVATGTTTLVSKSINGGTGLTEHFDPMLSADGRYVTFTSDSTDLISGTQQPQDYTVFMYDRVLDELNPVSLTPTGEFPDVPTERAFISSTGEFVLALSSYSGFTDNDDNSTDDLFLFKMALETNLTVDDASISEGDGSAKNLTFTVTSDQVVTGGFTVNYATSDGTATAGEDYIAASGTLTFAGSKGEIQNFTVSITGDNTVESNETFTVSLSNPSRVNINVDTATGTITNDDFIIEVLTNGGFEGEPKPGKIPQGWFNKNTNLIGKDKQKCNTLDKTFSRSDKCAFMFKGNPTGEKTMIKQKVTAENLSVFTDGATVTFSVYVKKGSAKVGHTIGKLLILYDNNTLDTLTLKIPDGVGYTLVSQSLTLDLTARNIALVKVQFRNKLRSGKFFLDDASLTVTPATTLRAETRGETLPLPEAPSGFRD